jgi:hypothetical protein
MFRLFKKKGFLFYMEHIFEKLFSFYQFFRVALLQIHFGSGAFRIRNNFFRFQIKILVKISDPTGSGSTALLGRHIPLLFSVWFPETKVCAFSIFLSAIYLCGKKRAWRFEL